mgnify:CR=1 FL=1
MKFAKRKNMTLLFLLFMSMILMGIGYASIQSVTGEITGKASSKMQDGVFITNVEYVSDVDANKDSSKIELYSGTMMKSTVKLSSTNINSQIKYKVTVYNNSEERQPFTGVRHGDEYYDNNDIIFEVNGFKPGQTIEPKETKDIIITFKYKNNIPENTVLKSYLNFKMSNPNRMVTADVGDASTNYLTGTVTKDKIETVKFEMGKEPTDVNIISKFDASEKQDGSIIGYYTDKDNNGLYELTFVSEEVIYANKNAQWLFGNLNNVKEFKFYNFSTFKVKEFNYMFYACFLVTDLDISSFDTSYATYINGMFCECRNLQTIDLKNFDTSKVIDMRDMFGDCYSLSNINFGEFDTSSVTDMWHMFNGCTNLEKLNLSGFDTTNVTNMNCMFYQCTSLTELDLSFFDTKNVTDMEYMFSKCSNLKIIYVKELDGSGNAGWSTASIKNSNYMFLECEKIVGGNGTTYNAEHIDATYARIDTDGAPGYFTKKGQKPSEDVPTEPYLPTGFTKVEGTSLANGYTIQDSTGNQYVWVEVPKTSEVYPTAGLNITGFSNDEYAKIETDLHTYTNDYRDGTSYKDEYYSDAVTGLTSAQYIELKQKMLKSVYQNGGFYVGKYETGIEDSPKKSYTSELTQTPVIKQNAYPYNYVTCSQAQTLASNMESGNYNTSLMFGVQWDLVLKYLETKGTAQADLKTDSTSWGNYSNNLWNITNENSKYAPNGSGWTSATEKAKVSKSGILLSTGASDDFSKQGIYDLAGNVWEWTLEYTSYSSNACARRGGYYDYYGSSYPAAYRSDYDTTFYNNNLGFRLSLY